jgi:hypothetical protein
MMQPQRVFLAHAREDKERVRALYRQIRERGFSPWLDEEDLVPGQNWKIEIPKAIRDAGVFIACLSQNSVRKQGFVHAEFRLALAAYGERPPGSIYLIPVRLDDCEVPDLQIPSQGLNFRDFQWLDLGREGGFERLIKAIEAGLSKGGTTGDASGGHCPPNDLSAAAKATPEQIAEERIAEAARTNATALDLSNLGLAELPDTLFDLSQLRKLELHGNRLSALPDAIGRLTRLERLNLPGNQLRALPETIGRLTRLTFLGLSRNQLRVLPESLGLLTRLKLLYLDRNQLSTLPESLRHLSGLERLFLHGNERLGLPPDVVGPTWSDVRDRRGQPAPPADILAFYFRSQEKRRPDPAPARAMLHSPHAPPVWERVATFAIGIVFVATLLAIALSVPNPTDFQIFTFRVVLALAAAALGALIPGFIDVRFRGWLRAGGAIALFVIVYMINPPALVSDHAGRPAPPPDVGKSR